jgi:uncharacterized protein (DUF1778 family)
MVKTAKPGRRGRPRLAKKKDRDVTIRLTQDDRDLFKRAAERAAQRLGRKKLPLSEWLRDVASSAAEAELSDEKDGKQVE